ncbi:hypothetical protein B0H10DRAFT_2237523 [Mycena sp. CBHHK59/15]|nr:hypothetical protein B0H10DRAFT_2237523 [Mycena sp. CBHHK59/15]
MIELGIGTEAGKTLKGIEDQCDKEERLIAILPTLLEPWPCRCSPSDRRHNVLLYIVWNARLYCESDAPVGPGPLGYEIWVATMNRLEPQGAPWARFDANLGRNVFPARFVEYIERELRSFVYGLNIQKISDWWRHKEIDPWIIPCIIKSQSQIPADIWDATPSTTNTNEAQHHWTNSLTGTKLTPVEALESRRRVDQNVADEIKMSLKTGILSNSNNELSHRMARNSQRQSAVARRATESRDAANVSKDLQRRIDEEAEKRRLSNETTKFLKAQRKDAKARAAA